MTVKHTDIDDYPFLAYAPAPGVVVPEDVAGELEAINEDGWVTTDRIEDGAVTPEKLAPAD